MPPEWLLRLPQNGFRFPFAAKRLRENQAPCRGSGRKWPHPVPRAAARKDNRN